MNFSSLTHLFVHPRPLQHLVVFDAFDSRQQVTWSELLSDVTVITEKLLKTDYKNQTICCADSDLFACEWICSSYVKRKHS